MKVTRRSFIKNTAAMGAALAIAGCAKSDDGDIVYTPQKFDEDYTNPKSLLTKYDRILPATSPHNCGGACQMLAFVKDDVIVGIGTDENQEDVPVVDPITNKFTFEDRADSPRSIACIRCRSHKSLMYSANRLLYPMIQRGERGNLDTFERVSWKDALEYMFDKIKTIRSNYGPAAFMKTQTTGAGGFTTTDFQKLTGTHPTYRVNWSFYAYNMTMPFICGTPNATITPTAINDTFTSDYVILWAQNFAESLFGQDNMWRASQMKEYGVRVKVIDTHICTTANTLFDSTDMADNMYVISAGTDTALICGMIHTMLTDSECYAALKTLWGATTDEDLWKNVGKLLYGFFDNNELPGKMVTASATVKTAFNDHYLVPAGGSFSAYIFGNSDKLVQKGLNRGTSIYPNHIRYNVWDHSDSRCHPAAAAKTWCYGQVEKDAAWASKITGISEARIKELAKIFVTKNVSVLSGYSYNRNTEGESEVWAINMFIYFTKCFGGMNDNHLPAALQGQKKCRTYGSSTPLNKYDAPNPNSTDWSDKSGTYDASINNSDVPTGLLKSNGGYLNANYSIPRDYMYDESHISLGATKNANGQVSGNQPTNGAAGISCFALMDAIRNTNKPKVNDPLTGKMVYPSDRNDGQVKHRYGPLKGLFNTSGGQPINQYGDVFRNIETMLQKDTPGTDAYAKNCHPQKYSLELFAVADPMFTTTCLWADVLLPTAMSFEREDVQRAGSFGGPQTTRMCAKVRAPWGDALDERTVHARFAELYGKKTEYYNGFVDPTTEKDTVTGETFEEKHARNKYEKNADCMRVMNYTTFRRKGFITAKMVKDAGGNYPSANVSSQDNVGFLDAIVSAEGVIDRASATGKYEAYCVSIVDDYRARYMANMDSTIDLVDNGQTDRYITAKSTLNDSGKGKGMFVYPVPMYVPLPEGIHGDGQSFKTVADGNNDGIAHPDPLNIAKDGYTKYVCTYHPMKRCHSTHSNNPLVTDFYKKDKDGKDAYISYDLTARENTLDGPWKEGVYEPMFTNENTTYTGSTEKVKQGDLVIIESKTGAVKVSVVIDNGVRPDTIMLPQGAWNMVIPSTETAHGKIDVGGNVNSLTSHRSTRIGGGPAVGNDTRAKLIKAQK